MTTNDDTTRMLNDLADQMELAAGEIRAIALQDQSESFRLDHAMDFYKAVADYMTVNYSDSSPSGGMTKSEATDIINEHTDKLGLPRFQFKDDESDGIVAGRALTWAEVRQIAKDGGTIVGRFTDLHRGYPAEDGSWKLSLQDDFIVADYGGWGMDFKLSECGDGDEPAQYENQYCVMIFYEARK